MGIGAVVMGVDGVVMYAVGVGTGGVDTMVSKVVTAAPEISCGTPLQIRSHQQRPGA